MTLRTYRLGDDGERVEATSLSTFDPGGDHTVPAPSLRWPACRCPRCRTSGS